MKRFILLLAILPTVISISAQSFTGYRSSNYTGVNGVFFNPANIADSRYRWDVNLFGVNAGVANNTASFNVKTITKLSDDNIDSILLNGNKDKFSAAANVDIFGPSFMFNASKKVSLALTTRLRAIGNAEDIDTKLIKSINDNTDDVNLPYVINSNNNQKITANGFVDIGLSAAMELVNKQQNFLKGGVSVKFLGGVSNNFVNINKINGTIDEDVNGVFITDASGTVALGHGGADFKDAKLKDFLKFKSNGIGADIGFVYEYRPDYATKTEQYQNKYKLKIGVAVLDIGAIKYVASPDQFNANYTIDIQSPARQNLDDFGDKDYGEIKDFLDANPAFYTNNGTENKSYSVSLPTLVQANVDYNISGNFYTDIAAQLSVTKTGNNTNSYYTNNVTVTPRFESKVVDVSIPLNYNALSNFNAGLGLRAGPLYIGSGSIFTALFDNSKQADVYIGLHVGMQHKPKKVKEIIPEPIVIDTVVTPVVIPDSDNDGLNDNEDKCPFIFGTAKYNGCPVPDTDSDGINDEADSCVTVAGLAKYNGCPVPDTDGDGVNDEEDRCPAVAGIRENFGCPEIKQEVIKKVNFAASHLLFATGKSKILPASYASLNVLAAILESDQALKLNIDGHTDNVGKVEMNQLLSEARANAAKEYLVKKGIAADRIITIGYGDTKPVADNKTKAGKTKNRRIEMKVFN